MELGKTVAGIVLGIGIGTLIGVLFAPAKGSRTRRKILDHGQDCADDLKDKFEDLCQDVSDKYDTFIEEVDAKLVRK